MHLSFSLLIIKLILVTWACILLQLIFLYHQVLWKLHLHVDVSHTDPRLWSYVLVALHVVLHPPAWSIEWEEVLGKANVCLCIDPVTFKIVVETLLPDIQKVLLSLPL